MNGTRIITYLINFVIGIAQLLIGLRIVLKLFGASEQALFVEWIYETSQPLLHPFQGMFPSSTLNGVFVIEFSALFALLVYTIIGYLLVNLIAMLDSSFGQRKQ